VSEGRPDVVYHLAALSSVGRSWENPGEVLHDNVAMTLNVLEAVRREAPHATVLVPGTGELYGRPDELPTREDAPLRPQNPYAVSKASADLLAGLYADAHGLAIIRARPFNHAGPGQQPIFAIASFARQAAAGRVAGDDSIRIVTGNPDTRRDFTDVRDVVRAYRMLVESGARGVFNVCSGRSESAAGLVAHITRLLAPARVEHVIDPALVRDHEVMEIRGSHDRLTELTGWQPEIPLERTLADTLAWWETELAPE
jgi:GDP-4-dehydro-6-deoxy-D-mannose reductase